MDNFTIDTRLDTALLNVTKSVLIIYADSVRAEADQYLLEGKSMEATKALAAFKAAVVTLANIGDIRPTAKVT